MGWFSCGKGCKIMSLFKSLMRCTPKAPAASGTLGINWTTYSGSTGALNSGQFLTDCNWDGTNFVIASYDSATGSPAIAKSPTGQTWTTTTGASGVTQAGAYQRDYGGYIGGKYFNFHYKSDYTTLLSAYSANGTTGFTSITASLVATLGAKWGAYRLRYCNGTYFLAGGQSISPYYMTSARSTDGITWSGMSGNHATITASGYLGASDYLYSNGVYYMLYSNGTKVASSTDSFNWTFSGSGLPSYASYLFATATAIFAWTPSGYLYRSTDGGVTWADISTFSAIFGPAGGSPGVYAVAVCGATLIAGGGQGKLMTSWDDGVTWTERTALSQGNFYLVGSDDIVALGWNGTSVVAIGRHGYTAVSS